MKENEKIYTVEFSQSELETVLNALFLTTGDDDIGDNVREVFSWLKRWPKSQTREKIENLLLEFFNNDEEKVFNWLNVRHRSLGGVSPNTLIELGRGEKLLDFIETSLNENKRDIF